METGDWVQARKEITEADFNGQSVWTHARRGAVGHVLEVFENGLVNVYFEAVGTVTLCDEGDLVFLSPAEGPEARARQNKGKPSA